MEFLVEFDVAVPEGTPGAEAEQRENADAAVAADLVGQGHLLRLWKLRVAPGKTKAFGLYRVHDEAQLDDLLGALPPNPWRRVTVTNLEPHPNDPTGARATGFELPDPRLTPVYRLDAALGHPLDVGESAQGRRRIVPLASGTFTGPELSGTLVPGVSADWQIVLEDGTALGDIRYTLQTNGGDLLSVRSWSVRHGSAEVLARLEGGEDVDASDYTFRAATQIETAAPGLDWLNKGVFISSAAREATRVIYETYLVG